MAHNLNIKADGKAALYLLKQSAWHGLGTVVEKPVGVNEMFKIAGLDWTVRKDLLKCGPNNIPVPGKFGIIREDNNTILGVVGAEYTSVQNHEMKSWCAALGEWMDSLVYEAAGTLGKGETVWVLIRMDDSFKFGKKDQVFPYLMVSNNHNGTRNLINTPTTIRVVCQNTVNMACEESNELNVGYRIMHTSSIEQRMKEARETIIHCSDSWKNTQVIYTKMGDTKMKDLEFESYIETIFGKPTGKKRGLTVAKKRDDRLNEIFHSETCTVDGMGNTVWAGFNAVTEYLDHESLFHETTGGEENNIAESRFFSTQFGNIAAKKNKVWDAALALV